MHLLKGALTHFLNSEMVDIDEHGGIYIFLTVVWMHGVAPNTDFNFILIVCDWLCMADVGHVSYFCGRDREVSVGL